MSEPQIIFEDVAKRFGDIVAVESMNLSVDKGEFLAIMGSSGCGKTTTLRMLAGLEMPSEGEIRLNGKRINELKPSDRETPMVWQTLALFPFLSVVKNVEFGLRMRGLAGAERRRRAMQWLERMEIAELAGRNIDQLSGGQKQRVALARALVTEPPVLLLDEPLSALDANLVVRMQGVLSRLQNDLGITFVYVTHSQTEAFSMADRVVIMSQGKIEQIGSPKQVYRSPASRFVAEFVGTNNIYAGVVSSSAAENICIDTEIGVLESASAPHLCDAERATAVIAADRVELNGTCRFNVSTTVIGEEFAGSMVTVHLETGGGSLIRAQISQRETDRHNIRIGAMVSAGWNPDDVYLIV